MERYYETFGRPGAPGVDQRAAAGDRALGDDTIRCPRRSCSCGSRRRRSPTTRSSADQARARGKLARSQNGEGGICEIEFFVQALQLIHGGKRPNSPATLAALNARCPRLVSDDTRAVARLSLAASR
jgi:glutamate-ammonia-ligase adenylyltransferase